MKVYFKKTGGVVKVTEERDSKPFCNTTYYRKNFSQLTVAEMEEYIDFCRQEAIDNEIVPAHCMVCGKSMGTMKNKDAINAVCDKH